MSIIISDSTCDLTIEEAKVLGVKTLPIKLFFGADEYIDKITITNSDFYARLAAESVMPTTTLLNPDEFLNEFEKHPDDDIIVLTLSSKLSGSHQSAVMAKEMSERDNIYVVDSRSVSIGFGLLVTEAARLNSAGVPASEIAEIITELAGKVRVFAIVDTLKYLIKGGRLGSVSGYVGTLLDIKPIIGISDGEVQLISKARGYKETLKKFGEIVEKHGPIDMGKPVFFGHGCSEENMNRVKGHFGFDAPTYIIGSVVGVHAGPGAAAIAYFKKE